MWAAVARCLHKRGLLEQSLDYYTHALALADDPASSCAVHEWLAELHVGCGDKAAALRHYHAIVGCIATDSERRIEQRIALLSQ